MKRTLLFLYSILLITGLVFGVLLGKYHLAVKEARAIVIPKVNICHCEQPDSESPFQCQTLNIALPAAIAHLTQHEADHSGSCSQDVCENLDGIQESTPEGYVNEQGYCYIPEPECEVDCEEPEEPREPEITPPPVGSGAETPKVCDGKDLGGYAPTITEVGRLTDTKIYARWTKSTEATDQYLVWYGVDKDNLLFNVIVKGEYAEIGLPDYPNQHVWLRVAAYDCTTGAYSLTVDP